MTKSSVAICDCIFRELATVRGLCDLEASDDEGK
jgi:hypothetical protein